MANNTNTRIGIIGGGISGLTSALFLREKGYSNVTVLEKEASVGGKALTVDVENDSGITHNYELGAEFITYTYDNVFELCKLVDEPTLKASNITAINKEGSKPLFVPPIQLVPTFSMFVAVIKYIIIGLWFRKEINAPNNLGLGKHKVLSLSLEQFLEKYKLTSLKIFFLNMCFGYNQNKDFPVIFAYRMLSPRLLCRVLAANIKYIKKLYKRPIASIAESGTQGMLKKLEIHLNESYQKQVVFRDQNVVNISTKSGDKKDQITVITDKGEYTFDALIFSIPPSFMLKMKEENQISKKELELFNRFQFHPYHVSLIATSKAEDQNLPKLYFNNIFPGADAKTQLEPVQFCKRWKDTNVVARGFNWESSSPFNSETPEDLKNLEQSFHSFMKNRMGITEYKLLKSTESTPVVEKYWDNYYPHVSIQEFRNGFYDEMESLQGHENIYFAGSSMNFEMMETTVKYSKYLIKNYF